MNEAAKKAGDELIEKFRSLVNSEVSGKEYFEFSKDEETKNATKCAIIAVEYTIKALDNAMAIKSTNSLTYLIYFHKDVLTYLKSL